MPATIFDELPVPPAARLLGWKLVALDIQAGTIEVQFEARPEFTNPAGFIQGGFLAAMLDDTLGPAAFAMTGGRQITTTIDLHVHYLRPVLPGPITTRGGVVNLGKTIAFLTGELFNAQGGLSAKASASAILTDYKPA